MTFGKRLSKGLILALAIASAGASADDDPIPESRWYVAPMGSYVIANSARNTGDGYGAALALGKRIAPQMDFEFRVQYLQYKANGGGGSSGGGLLGLSGGGSTPAKDVTLTSAGLGVSLFPFLSGRGLFLHGDAMAGDARLYNLGVGYDYDFGSDIALRAEALYHSDTDAGVKEPQFNLGVRIPFGPKPKPYVAPAPVQVVPPAPPPPAPKALCSDGRDNDGDGAIDYPADPGCTSANDNDEANPRCAAPEAGQTVDLDGCAVGTTLVLRGVNFDFDKATLTVNAKALLDQVADALIKRGDITVEVAGHTDSKGADAYNQRLSDARARAVVDYLASKGVARARMTAVGYGESMPIADNATDEGRALNRRVELRVLTAQSPSPAGAPASTPFNATSTPDAETPPASPAPTPAPAPQPAMPMTTTTAAPATAQTPSEPSPPPAAASAPSDSGGTPAAPAASAVAVDIVDYAYSPETVHVAAGGTVTWTNRDRSSHIVKFADSAGEKLLPGQTYSRTFEIPGSYAYVCGIHSSMHGVIVVE